MSELARGDIETVGGARISDEGEDAVIVEHIKRVTRSYELSCVLGQDHVGRDVISGCKVEAFLSILSHFQRCQPSQLCLPFEILIGCLVRTMQTVDFFDRLSMSSDDCFYSVRLHLKH